jgi:hypothetical protein
VTFQSPDRDDLAAGIFGDIEYAPTQPAPKTFKPWHRPRKQYVRREQLLAQLRRLYQHRRPDEPLRYLGLPGTDLIDLRYIHDKLCSDQGRILRFLGFSTEAQPGSPAHVELSLSLDEVRRLSNVDPQSDVIPDDFRRIGDEASIAWSRARSLGPFDVVNIDLCDGLASDPPHNDGAIYGALAQLVALQTHNTEPWLLLVSTRIGQRLFDADAEQRLLTLFRNNVMNCEGFVEACREHLNLDAASVDPTACNETEFLSLMIVAIGKWLSALVQAQRPSRVNLASTHAYRIEPAASCEDLVSLALRFEPIIAASPDALSPTAPPPRDECTIARHILKRSAKRRDVDGILSGDSHLHEELIRETEQLLAGARYDVPSYRDWLRV